ncbi:TPA: hypothetical protein EYP27_00580 [Candidatus Bathyarchaeota archaeon]|nr:hypothetical protein [Candidatus Bathyarchaeota archaeon]
MLEARFKRASSSGEIYRTLTDVIATNPTYVIVIDKKTGELEEALKVLSRELVKIIEFKTYEREGIGLAVHAHLFDVIAKEAVKPPPSKKPKSWNERLEWINPSCRQLVEALIKNIEDRFLDVRHEPCGRHYCFYRLIDEKRRKFAALIPTKNKITVAILAIPQKFKDEKGITWSIKGWFFGMGLERRFNVKSQADFDYALRLIGQAYEFSALRTR